MSHLQNPGTNLRHLLLFAAIVAASGLSTASPMSVQTTPPPPTTWTVTIGLTGSTLTYKNTTVGNTCSTSHSTQPPTGSDLYVCQGDDVYWQFTGLAPSEMYIIHKDHVMHDNSNPDRTGFHGSNGTRDGGTINATAPKTSHPYHVLVWDPTTNTPYFDDPKIMIGGSRGSGSKGHGHGQDKKSSSAQ